MKRPVLLYLAIIYAVACQKNIQNSGAGPSVKADVSVASANDSLELVYSDSMYELTGIAVSRTGRMFTNYPLWNQPHKYDVGEITSLNQVSPYPNLWWNSWHNGEEGSFKWVCVQAVYIDDEDKLWVDPASPFMKGVYGHDLQKQPKYNTASQQWPLAKPFTIYRIKL